MELLQTVRNPKIPSKKVIDLATWTSYSGGIPTDDTVPQITEGTEIFSQSISLKSSASKVLIKVALQGAVDTANSFVILAAFRNNEANAVGTSLLRFPSIELNQTELVCLDTPATQGSVTYSIRLGVGSGLFFSNGNSGSRILGGASKCTFVLEEILP